VRHLSELRVVFRLLNRTDFNLRGAIYIRDGMTSASLV
jgi:hypothetical protein